MPRPKATRPKRVRGIEAQQKYRAQPHGLMATRDGAMRRRYGLTLTQYVELFDQQGGVCAVCGEPPGAAYLQIDHHHKTGEVRGLCHALCNKVLGMSGDHVGLLRKAAAYLGKAASDKEDDRVEELVGC